MRWREVNGRRDIRALESQPGDDGEEKEEEKEGEEEELFPIALDHRCLMYLSFDFFRIFIL